MLNLLHVHCILLGQKAYDKHVMSKKKQCANKLHCSGAHGVQMKFIYHCTGICISEPMYYEHSSSKLVIR